MKDAIEGEFESFHPVLSLLGYLMKAPAVPEGTPVVNALNAQRQVSLFTSLVCLYVGNICFKGYCKYLQSLCGITSRRSYGFIRPGKYLSDIFSLFTDLSVAHCGCCEL